LCPAAGAFSRAWRASSRVVHNSCDADFDQKMADVLCVYREVQVLKKAAKSKKPGKPVAIVSYDEKPGIQAIATTAPDLSPKPGKR
jgi:hypothetical protein